MIRTYSVQTFDDPSAAGFWLSHLDAQYISLTVHAMSAVSDRETSVLMIVLAVSCIDESAEANR